jgi:NADH-quinone oxidoreductase subunit M
LLAIAGAWQSTALGPLAHPLAIAAGIGTALASAYLLRVLREVWQGKPAGASASGHAEEPPASVPGSARRVPAQAGGAHETLGAEPAGHEPAGHEPPGHEGPAMADATLHEVLVNGPLVAAIVVLGLIPWPVFNLTADAVRTLLEVTK